MPKALSLDLRTRIAAAVVAGEPVRWVAVRFQASPLSAVRLGQKQRAGAGLEPAKRGGPRARLSEKPDLTMRALAAELRDQGTSVTHDTVWRFVRRAGLTVQKKTPIALERERPEVARFRRRWRAHQHRVDPDRLIFVDETWMRTDMTRTRG